MRDRGWLCSLGPFLMGSLRYKKSASCQEIPLFPCELEDPFYRRQQSSRHHYSRDHRRFYFRLQGCCLPRMPCGDLTECFWLPHCVPSDSVNMDRYTGWQTAQRYLNKDRYKGWQTAYRDLNMDRYWLVYCS